MNRSSGANPQNTGLVESAVDLPEFGSSVLEEELTTALLQLEAQKRKLEFLQDRLQSVKAELAETRARHTELYHAATIGYLDLNEQGIIRDINSAAAELLGRTSEALIGKPFSIYLRGPDAVRFSEHLRLCAVHGQKHAVQLQAHLKDTESPVPILLSTTPVRTEGESFFRCRTLISENSVQATVAADHSERLTQEQAVRREAEHDRDFIRQVLSLAPVMIGALQGRDLRLKWVNQAAAEVLGGKSDSLLHQPLCQLLPQGYGTIAPLIDRLYETGKPVFVPEFVLRLSNSSRWVQLSLAPLSRFMVQPTGVIFMALDITHTKRSTEALASSENRLRLALHAARMATCDWSQGGNTISWSANHAEVFGDAPLATRSTLEAFQQIVHPQDRSQLAKSISESIVTGGHVGLEFRIVWPDGSIHWLHLQGQLFLDDSGQPLRAVGVVIEITPQKAVEASLRETQNELESRVNERTAELANAISALRRENIRRQIAQRARNELVRQLAEAQEDERRRISRELHDETGQHLTALLLGLKNLQPHLDSAEAVKQLKHLQALTGQLGEEIHRIAVQLRPTALDDLGLHKMLSNFLEEWSSRSGVNVEFHAEGLARARLPSDAETVLYRVVQEGLTNVSRHAAAKNVCVVLHRHPNYVSLILEDDGKGFDVKPVLSHGSGRARLGLRGMKERIDLCGGDLDIESIPNEGTTLFVRLPLSENKKSGG